MGRKKFSLKNYASVVISVVISFFFVALTVYSATTITNSINTGGTLTVSGASTLTGNVSASGTLQVTGITRFYDQVTFENGVGASSTVSITGSTTVKGAFNASGAATLAGALTLRGAGTLESTLAVTGSSTVKGAFNTSGPYLRSAGAIDASSSLAVADLSKLDGGFLSKASSTVDTTLHVGTSVGVATSSPAQELGVAGDISAGSAATTTVVIFSTGTGKGGCIELRNTGGQTLRIYATSTFAAGTPIPLYAELGNCQ